MGAKFRRPSFYDDPHTAEILDPRVGCFGIPLALRGQTKVRESQGAAFNDYYRIWYTDNAQHTAPVTALQDSCDQLSGYLGAGAARSERVDGARNRIQHSRLSRIRYYFGHDAAGHLTAESDLGARSTIGRQRVHRRALARVRRKNLVVVSLERIVDGVIGSEFPCLYTV